MIPNKVYDVLKYLALIALPAIEVFLNVCLPVWGVPANVVNIISITIPATATLLGSLIGVSSVAYTRKTK